MTYDSLEILADFSEKQNIPYPLLRDVGASYVDALGIRNTEYPPGHRGYGVPHPGILFVDATGIVRLKFAVPGYRARPPFEEVYSGVQQYLDRSSDK